MVSIAFFEDTIEPLGPVKKDCIQRLRQANILVFVLTKSHLPAEEYERKFGKVDFVIDYGMNSKRFALSVLKSYLLYVYDSGPLQIVVSNQCDYETELGFSCIESKNFMCFG
jgi:hypothetical protein